MIKINSLKVVVFLKHSVNVNFDLTLKFVHFKSLVKWQITEKNDISINFHIMSELMMS